MLHAANKQANSLYDGNVLLLKIDINLIMDLACACPAERLSFQTLTQAFPLSYTVAPDSQI